MTLNRKKLNEILVQFAAQWPPSMIHQAPTSKVVKGEARVAAFAQTSRTTANRVFQNTLVDTPAAQDAGRSGRV
jgi:hypothetical protein